MHPDGSGQGRGARRRGSCRGYRSRVDDPSSQARAAWRRGELPRRYFDPFIWSRKTRLILLGILVIVVAVVVWSMVSTADVRASLRDVTVASGQISYTA